MFRFENVVTTCVTSGIYESVVIPSKLFKETGRCAEVGYNLCRVVELVLDNKNDLYDCDLF